MPTFFHILNFYNITATIVWVMWCGTNFTYIWSSVSSSWLVHSLWKQSEVWFAREFIFIECERITLTISLGLAQLALRGGYWVALYDLVRILTNTSLDISATCCFGFVSSECATLIEAHYYAFPVRVWRATTLDADAAVLPITPLLIVERRVAM